MGIGLSNRRIIIFLIVFLVCLILIVGGTSIFSSWYSEQVLENLKGYSARLEEDGFTVKSKLLVDFDFDEKHEWHFFGDFRSFAEQTNTMTIYYDQDIKGLYYLAPISSIINGIEVNIFYYNKVF